MPENTRSSELPITTDDLFQGAVLADNRFSRFDKELIDKYFNDDGKKAIKEYVAKEITAYKNELLSKAKEFWVEDESGIGLTVKAVPTFEIQKELKVEVPMSLRTAESELEYQRAKKSGRLTPLHLIEPIREWTYWKEVANDFPYDSAFAVHNMLLPKRIFSCREDMLDHERQELDRIISTYAQHSYHLIFENFGHRRSVQSIFHLHLACYYDERK